MKKVLQKISMNWFHKIGYSAMVLSGGVMLFGFWDKMKTENRANIYTSITERGIDTHLTWTEDNYAIEFKWNEGFEFEKVISYEDLPTEKQRFIDSQTYPYQYRVFEVVHSFGEVSYEVYYLDKNRKLLHKMDF